MKKIILTLALLMPVSAYAGDLDNAVTGILGSAIQQGLRYGSTDHRFDVGAVQNSAVLGAAGILLHPLNTHRQDSMRNDAEDEQAYQDYARQQNEIRRHNQLRDWERRYKRETGNDPYRY